MKPVSGGPRATMIRPGCAQRRSGPQASYCEAVGSHSGAARRPATTTRPAGRPATTRRPAGQSLLHEAHRGGPQASHCQTARRPATTRRPAGQSLPYAAHIGGPQASHCQGQSISCGPQASTKKTY